MIISLTSQVNNAALLFINKGNRLPTEADHDMMSDP